MTKARVAFFVAVISILVGCRAKPVTAKISSQKTNHPILRSVDVVKPAPQVSFSVSDWNAEIAEIKKRIRNINEISFPKTPDSIEPASRASNNQKMELVPSTAELKRIEWAKKLAVLQKKYIRRSLGKYALDSEEQLAGRNIYHLKADAKGPLTLSHKNTHQSTTAKALPGLLTELREKDHKAVLRFAVYPWHNDSLMIPEKSTPSNEQSTRYLNMPAISTTARIPFFPELTYEDPSDTFFHAIRTSFNTGGF